MAEYFSERSNMKKVIVLLFVILFLTGCQIQSPPFEKQSNQVPEPASAPAVTDKPAAENNIDKLLQKSEDEILEAVAKSSDEDINLGFVALLLAKGFYPEVNIQKYLEHLDQMADELKLRIGNENDPEKIVRAINFYIYEIKGIRMGSSTLEQAERNEDKEAFLNSLLDTNRGNCSSLSTLYLSLAERLGIPLYPVEIPSHIFVRYDDGKFRRNIETTDFGNEGKDEAYLKYPEKNGHKLIAEDIEYFGFLQNRSKKDMVEAILRSRAKCFHLKGETQLAEQDWAKAIKLSSNPGEIYEFIANQLSYFLVQKDQDKALGWINKAIAVSPGYYLFYLDRGRIYGTKNDLDNALRDFNKAIELNQTQPACFFNRSRVYFLTREYEKALADADKNIELKPDDPPAWVIKGASLSKLNRLDEALKACEKAIEIKPDHLTAWYNKGIILRQLEKYDESLQAHEKATQISPEYSPSWYSKACLYALKNDKVNALKNLSEAIKLDPKRKKDARNDKDFQWLGEDEEFRKITSQAPERKNQEEEAINFTGKVIEVGLPQKEEKAILIFLVGHIQ